MQEPTKSGFSGKPTLSPPSINLGKSFAWKPNMGEQGSQDLTHFIVEMKQLMQIAALDQQRQEEKWKYLSNSQKQFFIDVLCWTKDEFKAEVFEKILPFIAEQIKHDPLAATVFFNSFEFHLFLKNRYHYYPFDQEEQNYPEEESFFLTKDFSFIFQYQEKEKSVDVINDILASCVEALGVEKFLSKLQLSSAENFSHLHESAYQERNRRLAFSSYPNYEEALEWQTPLSMTKNFLLLSPQPLITDQTPDTYNPTLRSFTMLKTLQAVFEFKKSQSNLDDVDSGDQLLQESLKDVNLHVKLGMSMPSDQNKDDIKQVYRYGKTLGQQLKKQVMTFRKKMMPLHWNWLGETIEQLAEASNLEDVQTNAKFFHFNDMTGMTRSLELFNFFADNLALLSATQEKLIQAQATLKDRLLNYPIAEVNFEHVILTELIHFQQKRNSHVLNGITWDQLVLFKQFWEEQSTSSQSALIEQFISQYTNLNLVVAADSAFSLYLKKLIWENITALDLSAIDPSEIKFISGVLLV